LLAIRKSAIEIGRLAKEVEMNTRPFAIYLLSVVLVVLSAVFLPSCTTPPEEELPTFVAHFVTPEGQPYPFDDVIISNGTYSKEFTNVTYIDTEVPENFTLSYVYERGGGECCAYVPRLPVEPDVVGGFDFYALDWSQAQVRTRPYILFQEVGANASLSYNWNPDTLTLTWNLTSTAGKYVGVGIAIDDNIAEEPNYAVVSMSGTQSSIATGPFPRHFPPGECVIAANHYVVVDGSCGGQIVFEEINPALGLGTITIGNALDNDAIVPVNFALKKLDGTPIITYRRDPQYAVPEGHYILYIQPESEPYPTGVMKSLNYPVNVESGIGRSIDNLYLPRIGDLKPFDFFVAAESAFSHSASSNLTNNTATSILSVDVSTETDYDWWGCFVLPKTATVTSIGAEHGLLGHTLNEGEDYTINPVGNYNIVCVRIEPEWERISLKYTAAPAV
jgi:hypothetical protein